MVDVLRDSKGQVRVAEAFLSAIIIFSALTICSTMSMPTENNDQEILAVQGMQVLIQLDNDGTLGQLISQNNWTFLTESLRLLLPVGIVYNLTVYDESLQQINSVPISNGKLSGNIVAVEYLCVSQDSIYNCYVLHLQLSKVK